MSVIPPKYVIECQNCAGSVTIIYGLHDGDDEEEIKKHLVRLMQFHLDNPPKPHPQTGRKIPPVHEWPKKVRPV